MLSLAVALPLRQFIVIIGCRNVIVVAAGRGRFHSHRLMAVGIRGGGWSLAPVEAAG